MDPGLQNTCDTGASYSREKQKRKDSTTQHEATGHLNDCTASFSDKINNTSNAKTENVCKAENCRQQLRVANTEAQEIEQSKTLQNKLFSRSKAEHDANFYKLRLRMMREKREAKMSANRTAEPRCELETGVEWKRPKSQGLHRRSAASDHHHLVASTFEEISPGQWLSNTQRESEKAPSGFLSESEALSPDSKRPSLRCSDAETFAVIAPPKSPSPSTLWRGTHPQPAWLNVNQDRIESHFILANRFLDDINTMLDFINGWPEYQFQDIAYAFGKDPENRGRITKFVDLGNQIWGVQILNPLRMRSSVPRSFISMYTFADLPMACQERGCDKGCPRKVFFKEKLANLKRFRLEQSRKTLLGRETSRDAITGKTDAPSFHLGVLSNISHSPLPPPATPLKMDGENRTTGLSDYDDTVRPSLSKTSEGPRSANTVLPAASQQLRDAEIHREKIKESVGKIKGHMSSKQASNVPNRDAVKEWLQMANRANLSSNSGSHDCAVDKRIFGSGGHGIPTPSLAHMRQRDEVPLEHTAARTVLQDSPVFESKAKGNESLILPQKINSILPSPEPAVMSDVILSTTLETIPSRSHVKMDDDDIPHRVLREEQTIPSTPLIRDDIDFNDDDTHMGYPENEPTMVTSTHASQTSDQENVRAYQRHIKSILRTLNARNERGNPPRTSAPSSSAPRSRSGNRSLRAATSSRSIPNSNTRPLFRAASRGRVIGSVRETKEKESGHDKKMLENLFEEL